MAQRLDGSWVFSPQDLVAEYGCEHRVELDTAARLRLIEAPAVDDPSLALLQQLGMDFEGRRLTELEAISRVKRLTTPERSREAYQQAWQETQAAMDAGFDAIYQATLFTGDFLGFADFLIAVKDADDELLRDADGKPVYEPVDTKSARSAKPGATIQVAAYAETLIRLGRPTPPRIHLWLNGDQDWSAPADRFIAVAREYRLRAAEHISSVTQLPTPLWAPPCASCATCRWSEHCEDGRQQDRDLSLIQEIRGTTRTRLINSGITTIDAMATASDDQRPTDVAAETFQRLRAQADIQIRGEQAGKVIAEVIDEEQLNALPPRSPGDLWFDMEGDPHFGAGRGLEYMFGYGELRDGGFVFGHTDALDVATERTAFEQFIDLVVERLRHDPNLHVYHYANYERAALQRLAQVHGTREQEVDELLRRGILVDLYKHLRKALRFSTQSLSIKYVEAIYGVTHEDEDVSNAMASVIAFEQVLALRAAGEHEQADHIYTTILDYNELDCRSTMQLDDWLREQMTSPAQARPLPPAPEGDDVHPADARITALEAGVPADPAERSESDHARARLSAAVQYYRREERPVWWELFSLMDAELDELERSTSVLVADRAEADDWVTGSRGGLSRVLRIASDQAEPRDVFSVGDSVFLLYEQAEGGMRTTEDSLRGNSVGTVTSAGAQWLDVRETGVQGEPTWDALPFAVMPGQPISTKSKREALERLADAVLTDASGTTWTFPDRAWADLLLARPPRTLNADAHPGLPHTGDTIADICTALADSADSYIAVQGPPGTGKTHVGSHVVAALAAQGWRIGVVAQSHAVVNNFLEAVAKHATVPIGKEKSTGQSAALPWDVTKVETWAPKQTAGYVIGGTAWTFARPAVAALDLDLLVIDEAGQFALADAVCSAAAAQRVLLLGDPQQLPQVSKATHPEGIERSVLAHITGAHDVLPPHLGYFLPDTYRMHPELTAPVSWLQYAGELSAAPVTATRELAGTAPGLHAVQVEHEGNTTSSIEEATAVVDLARSLIGRIWVDARDKARQPARELQASDIIVVAAFNAQVRLLRRLLDSAGLHDTPVGTVDKFQGREQAVVIVSMATSSAEDLPRGIEFLLSPNRLNVAISRAKWAGFLVHSPALRRIAPPSVAGIATLGGFLGLLDHAVTN